MKLDGPTRLDPAFVILRATPNSVTPGTLAEATARRPSIDDVNPGALEVAAGLRAQRSYGAQAMPSQLAGLQALLASFERALVAFVGLPLARVPERAAALAAQKRTADVGLARAGRPAETAPMVERLRPELEAKFNEAIAASPPQARGLRRIAKELGLHVTPKSEAVEVPMPVVATASSPAIEKPRAPKIDEAQLPVVPLTHEAVCAFIAAESTTAVQASDALRAYAASLPESRQSPFMQLADNVRPGFDKRYPREFALFSFNTAVARHITGAAPKSAATDWRSALTDGDLLKAVQLRDLGGDLGILLQSSAKEALKSDNAPELNRIAAVLLDCI